jgi:type VI protein secretion system component VasF
MSVKKDRRRAQREARQEQQANKVIKWISVCLILLAVIAFVFYSVSMS